MNQLENTCRLCLSNIGNGNATKLFTPGETEIVPHAVVATIRTVLDLKVGTYLPNPGYLYLT